MNVAVPIVQVFVYGTLKRGQLRQHSWPRKPRQIEPAWTFGRLYDLGPYPALVEGTDRVLGELWQFAPEDLLETLRVLDDIEGFHGLPDDLYSRVEIECTTAAGECVRALAYRFARPLPPKARLITAVTNGICQWP